MIWVHPVDLPFNEVLWAFILFYFILTWYFLTQVSYFIHI